MCIRDRYYTDRNFVYSAKGTYGTSGWMGRKEMKGVLDLRGQIQSVQEERDTLEQQVEEQRLANQQLEDAIENSDDPETLERVAREKGYVKEGETLYIDVAG